MAVNENWESLPTLSADLNVIQKLDDEPNDIGGLTASELKAKFDESGNAIKTYLNDTLLPAIKTAGEGAEGDVSTLDTAVSGILDGTTIDSFGDVETALAGKQDSLTIDASPSNGSSNPVASGGVYTALSGKQNTLTFDNVPTNGSNNPVKSGGVYSALSGKQNTLTFDTAPTYGSTNPVTSGGVYNAISGAGSGSVTSVNGKVGAVTLSYSDVSAPPTGHASSEATYGAGTGSVYGHVKLSDSTSSTSDNGAGIAATPKAVKAAYDAASGKAPTSHASDATTYGAGTSSNYGHVKLSDATNSTSSTTDGTAATPAAVKAAYDLADGKAPTAHASSATTYGTGTSSNYGHVKLSDSTSSSTAASSGGTAATPAAVKAVNDRMTYGNSDLTAGTSSLTTGVFYAYYT